MKKYRFIIIILLLLIIGAALSPIKPVKNFYYKIFSPITSYLTNSSGAIGSFISNIRSVNHLANENEVLQKQINERDYEIAQLKEIKHENAILKKELKFIKKDKEHEFIGAKIISKSVSPFLRYILVDQGSKDQVKKDSIVMSQGYLVGKISEVFDDYSQIELISSPNIIIPVILQDSRATGLLRSDLEGFSIDDVPVDNIINEKEKVITNNLDENIPADILIGQVESVEKFESLLFQNIKVSSPIEFEKLEYVFILK